jgi:Icc-related predicted phosphoesterase
MKILAASDIHGEHSFYVSLLKAVTPSEAQAIVLAGDLLGYAPGFEKAEDAQRADAEEILRSLETSHVPVLYIMGNDDLIDFRPGSGPMRPIHGTRLDLGPYNFVGYRYSLPFMGAIYEKTEEDIARDLAGMAGLADDHTVFVTHSPAKGILDRTMLRTHAGSAAILDFIEKSRVRAHIHGHIHGGFGRDGRHFNVAALPSSKAMLIDLDRMTHRVIGLAAV